jgi:hypothetical protein
MKKIPAGLVRQPHSQGHRHSHAPSNPAPMLRRMVMDLQAELVGPRTCISERRRGYDGHEEDAARE